MTVLPSPRYRASKTLLVLVAAAGLAQCVDGPTSPRASQAGFAFSPTWDSRANRSTALLDEAGLPLDRVRIIVVKPVSDTVKDTTITMRRGDPEIALGLTVPVRPGEPLSATLQFKSGATILFQGTANVIAVPLSQSNDAPTAIAMAYVGPGVTATRVEVLPGSGVISTASPITFVATAFDVNNAPLANTPIDWTINDVTLGTVTARGVFTPTGKRGNLVVSATTPTSITGTATVALSPPPASITIVSGNNQTTSVLNAALAQPLVVEVKAVDGLASVGETVTFVALDGGSVIPATAVTDANGRAQTTLKSGSRTGTYNFSVVSGALTIGAIATAPAVPGAIAIISGDAQADTVLKTLANPFVVRVTDIAGVALPGATVTWTRLTGSGTLASGTSLTNASGLASVGYTLADGPGAETIRASVAGLTTTVTFHVQVIDEPGARATRVEVLPGAGTFSNSGSITFIAKAFDGQNVEQLNTMFTWSLTDATFGAISPAGVFTPSGKSGPVTVRATTRRGLAGSATVNVAQPGPAAIAIVSGDAQTDTVLKTLTRPFVVKITDVDGVAIAGATVTWTRLTGQGALAAATSVTNASGLASAGYSLADVPGTETIRASVSGLTPTVTFTVNVVDEPGARATRVDVTPASGLYSGSAPITFSARAFNIDNVEQLATPFTWSVNDATFGAITTSGVFTPTGKVGAVTVSATTRRGIVGSATISIASPNPTAIAIISGNAQIDTIFKALANPFVVKVTDVLGNPVSGATVTWTRLTGFGSPAATTSTTNAAGLASLSYTLGDIGGEEAVRASVSGVATTVTFTVQVRDGLGVPIVTGFAYLRVTPSPVSPRVGDTVTFTADSVGASGGTAPVSVTWASDNPGRGPIDATGRMIVKDTGRVVVTATRNGLVGHGRATVLPAPELVGFTFSPKTLNGITNAALTTSMTFSVRDAGTSGVASGTVTITSPTGVTRTCTASTPTTGTRRNGTFDCAITLTAGSDAGVWQVTSLVLTGSITRTFGQSVLATFGITTLTVNP